MAAHHSDILSDLISEKDLAERLCLSCDTLYRWRTQRTGPPWTKIGGRVWYSQKAVEKWVEKRQHHPLV